MNLLERTKVRFDAWVNAITGLGTSIDKVTAALMTPGTILSDTTLETLFTEDDISRKVVLVKPREMFREGYNLVNLDTDHTKKLLQGAKALDLNAKVHECTWLGRLYGGCILAADSPTPEEPFGTVAESVDSLQVVDKRKISGIEYENGQPLYYLVTSEVDKARKIIKIHHSRVIRFGGALTDPQSKAANGGWDHSVLQEAYEVIRQFGQSWQGVTHGLVDWSQAVFKIKGLIHMIGEGHEETLMKRMQIVNMSRSVARAVMVDADSEEFERSSESFQGIAPILDKLEMRLASVADIPVTLLFGSSPGGLNATGDSDFRGFYDRVASEQRMYLKPKLQRAYGFIAKRQGIKLGEDFSIDFRSLWSPTESEAAKTRETQAKADVLYINSDVLQPEEIALSRFANGYSVETILSDEAIELRKQALESLLSNQSINVQRSLLTPSDLLNVVRVAEARAGENLPPFGDDRDKMTVREYMQTLEIAAAKAEQEAGLIKEPDSGSNT